MSQQGGSLASDLGVLHRWLVATCAVLVIALSMGYALGIEAITRIQPDWPVIYPYTVVGLVALVVAMILFDRGGRAGLVIGRVLAAVPLAFGIVVEPAIGLGLLPSSDPVAEDYTLVTALPALAVVSTATCVLLLGFPHDRVPRIRFGLGVLASVIALLGLLSYVYGAASLFTHLGLTGTSMPTTILGLLIIAAALTARPDRPPLDGLDARYDGSLLRRLLPVLLVIPFVPALITWLAGLIGTDAESVMAITQLITVVLLLGVIILSAAGQSRARRALATERQRLWEVFSNSPTATAMLDFSGRILLANGALGRLLGTSPDLLPGRCVVDFVAHPDRSVTRDGLISVSSGGDVIRVDVQIEQATGESVWVDASLAPIRNADGVVTSLLVQCIDLTDRKHLERVLFDQAARDPLTGLLNRDGLARQLGERDLTPAPGSVTVVVYADVDHLKQVNDTVGHQAGDDLLREVSRRLQSCLAEEDIVARVGGDEFLVVTHARQMGVDPTAVVLSRLRDELTGPVAVGRDIITMSVSLGASAVQGAEELSAAISRADGAMYADKRRRRSTDRS
ncbi:MAG: GGDEF domain-containing protein [Candidatus Nanopelagicales bacterium]